MGGLHEVTGVDDDVLQMSALFEYSSSQKSLVSNQVLCKFAEDQREDIREDIWRSIMEAGSCSPSL